MIWIYRLLVFVNACVIAFSLVLAISVLTTSNFTLQKAVLVGWPIPQAIGFWAAARAKRAGKVVLACSILLGQLLIAGGITVAWLAIMVAAFPS